MKERWRQIPGYTKYEASTLGKIRSWHLNEWILLKSGASSSTDYLRVNLSENGSYRMRYVAELVLISFIGPRPEKREASHLNNIKTDNRLCNLAWETRTENQLRMAIKSAKKSDFTNEEKINIKKLLKQFKKSIAI